MSDNSLRDACLKNPVPIEVAREIKRLRAALATAPDEATIRADERAKVRALIQRAHDLLTDDRLNVEPPCYQWENDVGDLCRELREWMAQP